MASRSIVLAAKRSLKFEDQRAQVKDSALGIEVHEEVDVAPRHRDAPRH
jgi:hypothetical protein